MNEEFSHQKSSIHSWPFRFLDILIIISLLWLILCCYEIQWEDHYLILSTTGGLLFVFIAQMFNLYSNQSTQSFFSQTNQSILFSWILTWAFLIILTFLLKNSDSFSRLGIGTWALITPVTLIFYRAVIRIFFTRFKKSEKNLRPVAIVGAGEVGTSIAASIEENRVNGLQVVAFYDDNADLHTKKINDIEVIGCTSNISKSVNKNKYNEIYICLPLHANQKIKKILNDLTDTTAIVRFIPDLFTFNLVHASWNYLNGFPVINVYDTPLNSLSAKIVKRTEDLILSIGILTLISPIMLILAIGVKLTSQGPVFYRQTRVSWNGNNFEMLKFRSIPTDAEAGGAKWGGGQRKTNTKFGQFIRSTSLDELPQFINVLKGDMSIVGPRPERDIFVEQFRKEIPRYMQKHMVKAGITGWAQINGWRGDTSLEKRIEFDLDYIHNWTLWLDLKIILLTALKGFVNKNAY